MFILLYFSSVFLEMAEKFSIEEKVYAVSWALSNDNREISRRLFRDKYQKEPPSANHIKFWSLKLLETGSLVKDRPRSGRPSTASSDDNKENVKQAVRDNPQTSIRSVSAVVGVSKSSVGRILHKEKFHPFKPSYCQELYDGDEDRRLQFCQTIVEMSNNDPALIRKLVFSDECHFELHGRVNKHNIHFWGTENPHEIIECPVKTVSLTVWAAISYNGVLSFDLSRHTMNSERYCQILREKVLPNMIRGACATWFFQQDGAPPHYSLEAREILSNGLPQRWIGRRGAIEWPARSPDLTPCDFWLWPYLKSKVYNPAGRKFENVEELQAKITEELVLIPLQMFRDSLQDFRKRVDQCIAKDGEHFEC